VGELVYAKERKIEAYWPLLNSSLQDLSQFFPDPKSCSRSFSVRYLCYRHLDLCMRHSLPLRMPFAEAFHHDVED
jgi:hypothetical protein